MNTASEFMLSDMNALMVSTDANEQDLRDRLIKYKNEKREKELRARLIKYKNEKMKKKEESKEEPKEEPNDLLIIKEKNTKSRSEKDLKRRLQSRMRLRLYRAGKYDLEEGELLINYI
jgi:hypothetical protein